MAGSPIAPGAITALIYLLGSFINFLIPYYSTFFSVKLHAWNPSDGVFTVSQLLTSIILATAVFWLEVFHASNVRKEYVANAMKNLNEMDPRLRGTRRGAQDAFDRREALRTKFQRRCFPLCWVFSKYKEQHLSFDDLVKQRQKFHECRDGSVDMAKVYSDIIGKSAEPNRGITNKAMLLQQCLLPLIILRVITSIYPAIHTDEWRDTLRIEFERNALAAICFIVTFASAKVVVDSSHLPDDRVSRVNHNTQPDQMRPGE